MSGAQTRGVFERSHSIPHHAYPLEEIHMMIGLILGAGLGFRPASKCREWIGRQLGMGHRFPNWYTCRLWVLRLGLHKLQRAKEIADDWIWIIDHMAPIGGQKVLLIMGIRASRLPADGSSVKHEDLEPIALLSVEKSNGEIVFEQLRDAAAKTGVPRSIVSDGGGDIEKGIRLFREHFASDEIIRVYDIKHKTATILKRELEGSERWTSFLKLMSQTRKRTQQTDLGPLLPPALKDKARYMNLEATLEWAAGVLRLVEMPKKDLEEWGSKKNSSKEIESKKIDYPKLQKNMGWIRGFKADLEQWGNMLVHLKTTERIVQGQGLTDHSVRQCTRALLALPIRQRNRSLRFELLRFVAGQTQLLKGNERLLGSSDSIESVFGELKSRDGHFTRKGVNDTILTIPAMLGTTSPEDVEQAMTTVKTKDLATWRKEQFGETCRQLRMRWLPGKSKGEESVATAEDTKDEKPPGWFAKPLNALQNKMRKFGIPL